MPKSVADTLRNMERQGNPWGMPADDRIAWAEGLDVRELMPGDETDVLLFLGCAVAYDDRNKKVARSFVRLLQKAGVDFAILGLDEICCGETARRLGHEYLFQVFAEQNIEMFESVKFKRIVTPVPALLQHAQERVSADGRRLSPSSTTPSSWPNWTCSGSGLTQWERPERHGHLP